MARGELCVELNFPWACISPAFLITQTQESGKDEIRLVGQTLRTAFGWHCKGVVPAGNTGCACESTMSSSSGSGPALALMSMARLSGALVWPRAGLSTAALGSAMAAVAMWPTAQAAVAPCKRAAPGDIWGWGRAVLRFARRFLPVLAGGCGPACWPAESVLYKSLISGLQCDAGAAYPMKYRYVQDQHGFAAIRHPVEESMQAHDAATDNHNAQHKSSHHGSSDVLRFCVTLAIP